MSVELREQAEMESERPATPRPIHGGWGERIAWMIGTAVFVTFCALICSALLLGYLWQLSKTEDIGMSALLIPAQAIVTVPLGYIVSLVYVAKKASARDRVVANQRIRWVGVGAVLPFVAFAAVAGVLSLNEVELPADESYVLQVEQSLDLVQSELPNNRGSSTRVYSQGSYIGQCQLAYSEAVSNLRVNNSELRPYLLRAEETLANEGFTTARFSTTDLPATNIVVGHNDDRLVEVAGIAGEDVAEMTVSSFAGPCVRWRGENYLSSPPSGHDSFVPGWQAE